MINFIRHPLIVISKDADEYILAWLSKNGLPRMGETACLIHSYGGVLYSKNGEILSKTEPRLVVGVLEKLIDDEVILKLSDLQNIAVRIPEEFSPAGEKVEVCVTDRGLHLAKPQAR